MQAHENRCIKRAGVAGLRERVIDKDDGKIHTSTLGS